MTSHLDSHTTPDIKPEMIPEIPEVEYQMINMMYAALPICTQTEKTTFSCKDDFILMKHTQR